MNRLFCSYCQGKLAQLPALLAVAAVLRPVPAQASLFEGETLDQVAEVMSWIVLAVVPVVGITVFWLLHIMPEKIAEKRHHPQAKAIQCLCLLSLVFGGLLWPIAWIWAYTKPVLHKMAYGTDVDDSHGVDVASESEVESLRARVAELESELKTEGGKA